MLFFKTSTICSAVHLVPVMLVLNIDITESTETCICLKNFTVDLYNPIQIVFRGENFYIAEQRGIVRYFETNDKNGSVLLDISEQVLKTTNPFSEQGLLGFTLHPRYEENGKLYVFYMGEHSSNKFSQLSEFTAQNNVVQVSTERYLMRIDKTSEAGNGGQLLFGHDGFLYISVGDGIGDVGETQDSAQDPTSLLGKILRIDVDAQSFANGAALSYGIPPSNPFVGKSPWRPEVFAYGCRDMWRCSQDMLPDKSGERRIFCGDPGARAYEEINIIRGGRNYGWNVMEGLKCYNSARCEKGSLENEELPIHVYKHTSLHHAVVGGNVYRGKDIQDLPGRYIFGDALSGNISVLTETSSEWTSSPLSVCAPEYCPCDARENLRQYIMAFGQDTKGEMYILTTSSLTVSVNDGVALKMVPPVGHKTTCGASQSTVSSGYILAFCYVFMLIV